MSKDVCKPKQKSSFAEGVRLGLSADPKFLSSKYFYDNEGSRLFQEIMDLPEYYLTRSELEIFTNNTEEIYQGFNPNERGFDLIELGAGDGTKTATLVEYFLSKSADFRFVPIDISAEALSVITKNFRRMFPELCIETVEGEYFHALGSISGTSQRRKVVLFLGSNVGNFSAEQSIDFFCSLRAKMSAEDRLFVGFDLHKNPKTILNAYDDSQGITSKFNLNILKRINRELDADFDIENFLHYASYHPLERAARSFLISQKHQTVTVGALAEDFSFEKWEPIFVEVSQKFNVDDIELLAKNCGFEIVKNFFDRRGFYSNSLWKPID